MIASAGNLLDCGAALLALGHSAALQQDPLFELAVLHLPAALTFVPRVAAFEADYKAADWTLRPVA